jgi:hypothetical protein
VGPAAFFKTEGTMKVLAMLLAAAALQAQTTIQDTVRVPTNDGTFTGTLTLESPDIVYAGQFYARQLLKYNIKNGGVNNTATLTLELIPNVGAETEATRYRAEYAGRDGTRFNCVWVVPESSTPLKIWQVQRNCGPALSTALNPWQIAGAKENVGKALVSNGEVYEPATVMQDPTQLRGDIAIRGAGGVERLALGPPGTALVSNGTTATWQVPSSTGGTGSVQSYTLNFTNQTSVTVPRATHGFATSNLINTLYTAAGGAALTPVRVDPTTFAVTATFAGSTSGRLVIVKAPSYSLSFAAASTVTIPGAQHGLQTQNLNAACYTSTGQQFLYGSLTVSSTTYDAVFTFAEPATGRCVIQGGNL